MIQRLCQEARQVLVIEEGQPFIEAKLRGLLPTACSISGKLDGALPRTGELEPGRQLPLVETDQVFQVFFVIVSP